MKLIDILKEISEGKQVGTLYHFTSYKNMISIIRDNFILKGSNIKYVSFTRNKSMRSDTISQNVRITVDGNKLSDKYKIEPYADYKSGYGRNLWDESEERISTERYPNGIDISKVWTKIDILSIKSQLGAIEWEEEEPVSITHYNELIKLLKEKDIPYNILKKYD